MREETKNTSYLAGLTQVTMRIRPDQKKRLEMEGRARGTKVADVVRDSLDLAFAMKEELSKIVEGEYDENDPKNAPRLVHSLLFRVEERILSALDGLEERFDKRLAGAAPNGAFPNESAYEHSGADNAYPAIGQNNVAVTIDEFVSLISNSSERAAEIWIGAFLEIVPRLELVGREQLDELKYKGELWLEEHGYYGSGKQGTGDIPPIS